MIPDTPKPRGETIATSNGIRFAWRYFPNADDLGDASAYGRQQGRIALLQSKSDRSAVLMMARDEATIRLALAALRITLPRSCDPGRTWWLSGANARVAIDYVRTMEELHPGGRYVR